MKLFRIAALALLTGTGSGYAQPLAAEVASDQGPVIDLVTMGIGSLVWERHGHIALCVTDHGLAHALRYPGNPKNACYNYGIGNFHEPIAMGWGFFRGTTSFWVGKDAPERMLEVYLYFDRTVWVQPLPLDAEQKRAVISKLEHDILPENRYYAYDHFSDNCTTRTRDIIDDALRGALRAMAEPSDGRTFRDLAREGFAAMPSLARPLLLITDLAMGRSTDRVPTYWERMFLPQYLREAVAKKLGVQPQPIYTRKECRGVTTTDCVERGVVAPGKGPSGRVPFALLAILLTAPAWATRLWGAFRRTGLAVAILPYVLLGSVLTALAAISPLPYVRWNETCLVFFPLDIAVLFLPTPWRRAYAMGRIAMLVAIAGLLIAGILRQPLWALLPWPLIPMLSVWLGAAPERHTPPRPDPLQR